MESNDALGTLGSDTLTNAAGVGLDKVVETAGLQREVLDVPEEAVVTRGDGVQCLKQDLLVAARVCSADVPWLRGGLERMYFDHPQDPEISGMVEVDTTAENDSVNIELVVPGDVALRVVRFVQSLKREVAKPVEAPHQETICGEDTLPALEPLFVPIHPPSAPVITPSVGRLLPDEDEDDGLPPEVDLDDPVADPESRAVRGAL